MSRTCCLLGALMSLSVAAPQAQAPREWPTYPVKEAPAELRRRFSTVRYSFHTTGHASEITRELIERVTGGAIKCAPGRTSLCMTDAKKRHPGRTSARLRRVNAPKRGPRLSSRAMLTVGRRTSTGSSSISEPASA